jgi:hypothetical protein
MQSTIAEPGIIEIRYLCNLCPEGCELKDKIRVGSNLMTVMHQHPCHRFPSLMTAWKRIV